MSSRIDIWKKNKKHINNKYCLYYGGIVKKRDVPQLCLNIHCKHHSDEFNECTYTKCRSKIKHVKPNKTNGYLYNYYFNKNVKK